jgi:hypothetical protein
MNRLRSSRYRRYVWLGGLAAAAALVARELVAAVGNAISSDDARPVFWAGAGLLFACLVAIVRLIVRSWKP